MKKVKSTDTVIRHDSKENDGNIYTYELLMHEDNKTASYKIPLYSIKLHMIDADGNETDANVRDVFADIGKAISFYERLVYHLATPIDLRYIIEDEIC